MPHAAAGAGGNSIEVVYAAPDRVWRVRLELPADATAGEALAASGFARLFPEYAPRPPMLGIYGQNCSAEHVLRDGDRLEIYRPLDFDPQESRRRRAAHRQTGKTAAARAAGGPAATE